ncbi:polymer-forming cytoskeletal protein [Paraburkholderia terrae]|jgi:cytoskeletal protein CcmA (bactofilin family)|nr:polymer-forming cytoskeletal protein [Paraburkholderia sp. 22B1P]GJH05607.1 polymer-forming cytoskeletal protein [Paraburkholderia terrae]GJH38362.1 polymer-forming cytoskeletal protein [Paraburkholderia hospita]
MFNFIPVSIMFSKKKSPGVSQNKLATLIAHDVHITGDVEFSDGLRMDGHVKGNVSGKAGCETLLVLSNRGSITGNVYGYDLIVNGRITGDVIADHFVELQENAHITGNIYYQQLRMDVGASVDGKLTRRDTTPVPASPHIEPATFALQQAEASTADQ